MDITIKNFPLLAKFSEGGKSNFFFYFLSFCLACFFLGPNAHAQFGGLQTNTDVATNVQGISTIVSFVDTALFVWGARIFGGICVLGAGWALFQQRFPVAIIGIVAGLVFGLAPKIIGAIFKMGGDGGVFQSTASLLKEATNLFMA